MDSRFRGNDGYGLRGNALPSSHSRFRGSDGTDAGFVIPVGAGMIVRTAQPGTPPTVIPAEAGIHESRGGRGTSMQAGIHGPEE